MTDPEIVRGLKVADDIVNGAGYSNEQTYDDARARACNAIDAAISRLSATCGTCRYVYGTHGSYCSLHVVSLNDGTDRTSFCCKKYTPRTEEP